MARRKVDQKVIECIMTCRGKNCYSIRKVAELCGVSPSTVYRVLKKYGDPLVECIYDELFERFEFETE